MEAAPKAVELPGNVHLLMEQIGTADVFQGMDFTNVTGVVPDLSKPADLQSFLRNYHRQVLEPLELPSIRKAFLHGSRNEARELIQYDEEFGRERVLRAFAGASRSVGKLQLQSLRPMKDERLVQRYLAAVESGKAQGWHTLVYGLTLAVYSIPLRQGLIAYSDQITRRFIRAASAKVSLKADDEDRLFEEVSKGVTLAVEKLLKVT